MKGDVLYALQWINRGYRFYYQHQKNGFPYYTGELSEAKHFYTRKGAKLYIKAFLNGNKTLSIIEFKFVDLYNGNIRTTTYQRQPAR